MTFLDLLRDALARVIAISEALAVEDIDLAIDITGDLEADLGRELDEAA